MRGELTEIKTRDLAVDHRWATDAVREANTQIRYSGLDTNRPMTGLGGRGPQGQVELQLRGDAARNGPRLTSFLERIERDVPAQLLDMDGERYRGQVGPHGFKAPANAFRDA